MKKIITSTIILLFTLQGVAAYTLAELNATRYLANLGIVKEQSNIADYNLDATITRRETMKIIGKLSGKDIADTCEGIFLDVSSTDWGCKYIEFAYREGFIAQNTRFRPDDNITKTEAIKLILKARNIAKTVTTDDWKKDYMQTALTHGLINTAYFDYNTNALRGWIFSATTASIKNKNLENMSDIYSDEAL